MKWIGLDLVRFKVMAALAWAFAAGRKTGSPIRFQLIFFFFFFFFFCCRLDYGIWLRFIYALLKIDAGHNVLQFLFSFFLSGILDMS